MQPDDLEWAVKIIRALPQLAKIPTWMRSMASSLTGSKEWHHLTGSLRRRKEGVQIWSWECLGGITYNLITHKQVNDMDEVPPSLYQRALGLAKIRNSTYPMFDQKILGQDWTYRMVATVEGSTHVLAFYRRPKLWPSR